MDGEPVGDEPRAKRQKKDKGGRFAALQRLKNLQETRSKNKYEVEEEVANVYDLVDEKEYKKRVQDRQEEDWIVGDGAAGYVEDGREIFDDDLDSESIMQATKSGRGNKRKKKQVADNAGRGNLQYMLSTMPAKKNEEKLEDDDVLSELISEIDNTASTSDQSSTVKKTPIQRFSLIAQKKAVNNYMRSFTPSKPKPIPPQIQTDETTPENDDCTVDSILSTGGNEIEEVKSNVDILKEIQNTENETKNLEAPKKSKLLFTLPDKKKLETKATELSMEIDADTFADVDFDEDFDFDDGDTVETSTKLLPDITEQQLIDGFTINNEVAIETDVIDVSELSELSDSDKNIFRFYWWDAYEDERTQPGVVLLLGKTYSEEKKKFISCSLVVRNVQRRIYLLPRPFFLNNNGEETDKPVSIMDVYQEFNEDVAKAFNMSSYKSKKVTKKYAFDSSVPDESEYLEVRYEGKYDFHEKKYKTFSKIFGLNCSFMEIFLLERKIKGPCWLNISNFEISSNPFTYANMEVRCSRTIDVSVLESSKPIPPPPLTVLAMNIKAGINPINNKNEISLISCLVNNRYHLDKKAPSPPFTEHFCIMGKLSHTNFPNDIHSAISKYKATRVQKIDSEKALLNYFLAQFSKIDPDIIVGHDLNGYQLSILADRLQSTNATNYSRLSRVKRANSKNLYERLLFSGRLVCDIKASAKELIRCRSYDLDTLCQTVLKIPEGQRIEIEPENVPMMYDSANELFRFITLTMQDTSYILRMMYELNVMPLALQITNIAGNVMSRTLMGGRSERNEFLLLHAFYDKDYIVPEKVIKKKQASETGPKRKKPTYSGGLVLDPKVGFYDKLILLMDFNSLYPSIIQEYNICFTTMHDIDEADEELTELALPDKNLSPGILPTEIRKLVESRRQVKGLMKATDLSADLMMQYNIRQMALKLTANSMYGCLGFSNSRFYAKKLAALVTQKGREILTTTRDIVQKLSYDVIYGDTDSIMINTNITDYDQVFKIGKSIKQEINQMYKQVELDIDGVFKYLLLLKKKKYAAVSLSKGKNGKLTEVQEHKGLDIVRRDWSQLAAEAGKFILNQILCDQSSDDRVESIMNHLTKLKEDIEAGVIPMQLLVITKQLTKDPNQYPDKSSLPHVSVALRHNQRKGKKFKAGDTVPYVICKDGTTNSATQRAYLVDDLKSNSELKIDSEYYLAQQIFPVVSRICEPIDTIETHQIGNCLGIDVRIIHKPVEASSHQLVFADIKRTDTLTRYCHPLNFNCMECNFTNTISIDNPNGLEVCGNGDCNVRPVSYINLIKNKLVLAIREYQLKYYRNELSCEDPVCLVNLFRLPQRFVGKYPVCTRCKEALMFKVYTEEDFYAQLEYFHKLFDLSKKGKQNIDAELEAGYLTLKETVEKYLKACGYASVNLAELFSYFSLNKALKNVNSIDSTQVFDEEEEI